MRLETKKHIYTLDRIPTFWLRPEISWGDDVASVTWLWFSFYRISKKWLKFCEDHGGGIETTLEWVLDEITCGD